MPKMETSKVSTSKAVSSIGHEANSLVQQTGTETFEMVNSSVKMTVHEGRITGLYDVKLECVFRDSVFP